MAGMLGADTHELRRLAAVARQHEDLIRAVPGVLNPEIDDPQMWFGPDAETFRDEWHALFVPELDALAARIGELAADLDRNADEQDSASQGRGTGSASDPTESATSSADGAEDAGARADTPATAAMFTGSSGSSSSVDSDAADEADPADEAPTDLQEILEAYQVSEDPDYPATYSPPWPASMFQDDLTVTSKEKELLDGLALLQLDSFKDIRNRAFDWADERYPDQGREDGHNDAFRHAMWNALLARKYGESWAEDFATAHEQVPGNPAAREAMDLYNNEVGRRIEAENPNADVYQLADLIRQAMDDGELLVIDANGNLAWSNDIEPGQTGRADDGAPLPGREPNFNDDGTTSG